MKSFNAQRSALVVDSWSDFKKFLDGTTETLAFFFSETAEFYRIITEEYGGFHIEVTVNKDGGAAVTDFEGNYKSLATRAPVALSVKQSGTWTNDVSDRAGRLLGVVYGSQGQQLKQTATNFNLQTELATGGTLYDARQIRALTNSDIVSAQQSGSWTVSVSNFPATQPVSGTVTSNQGTAAAANAPWSTRLSDGTSFYDARQIRALTNADVVSAQQSGTWTVAQGTAAAANAPWSTRLSDGTSFYKAPTDAQLPSALVGGRLDTNNGAWLGSTAPTVGQKTMASSLPVVIASDQSSQNGQAIPVSGLVAMGSDGTNARFLRVDSSGRLVVSGQDAAGDAQPLDVRLDSADNVRRVQIEGRVSITAPAPPPATTPFVMTFSGSLSISSDQTDNRVITDGKNMVIQQIVAGCEGDTSERGSVVEVFFFDGSAEHLVERVYLNGFTTEVFPNTSKARDGTTLNGNGTTKTLRVKRRRLSGSTQEVDFVVRGYEYTP